MAGHLLTVRTPVEGYTGTVAGVPFAGGVGHVDRSNRAALRYFAQHGYTVGADEYLEALTTAPTSAADAPDDVATVAERAGSEGEQPGPARPASNASKADWLDFAIAAGFDPDEAAELKRDELVALFTTQEG